MKLTNNQEIILKATNTICDAVKTTLGTKGRTVLFNTYIADENKPGVTKDGATVARNIRSADDYENLVISVVREASLKTMLSAGDGTTTTCIIAQHIINKGMELLNSGISYYELAKGIDCAVNNVLSSLKDRSISIENDLSILQEIATISANDEKVGELIYDIVNDIGIYGNIEVKRSQLFNTRVDKTKGIKTNKGWYNAFMVNNVKKESFEVKGCAILILTDDLRDFKVIEQYIAALEGMPLLVFCESISEQLLIRLQSYIEGVKYPICFVENDEYRDRKMLLCRDIAVITGGRVVCSYDNFDLDNLGYAEEVRVTEHNTAIIGGEINQEQANLEVERIKELLESDRLNANTDLSNVEKRFYQRRLANYTGGMALIQVGGRTQIEMSELKDRIDDAVLAVESAIREGVSIGGGYTFINCKKELESNLNNIKVNKQGYQLVLEAIEAPFKQLLINSEKYSEHSVIQEALLSGQGYDLRTNQFLPLKDFKVYDATAVLMDALVNGVSVGKSLLSVKELIYDGIRKV